jgi:hypothetical protein
VFSAIEPDETLDGRALAASKDEFLAGFGATAERNAKYIAFSKQYAETLKSLLVFLMSKHGQYEVAESQLLFTTQPDLDEFNLYYAKLDSLAGNIEAVRQQNVDHIQEALDELKHIVADE